MFSKVPERNKIGSKQRSREATSRDDDEKRFHGPPRLARVEAKRKNSRSLSHGARSRARGRFRELSPTASSFRHALFATIEIRAKERRAEAPNRSLGCVLLGMATFVDSALERGPATSALRVAPAARRA